MPGWKVADPSTQARIIQAALRYLREGDPQNSGSFETDQIYHAAIAGFRALALVSKVAPDELANLPSEVWEKWAPISLRYPHLGEAQTRKRLLEEAHTRLPKVVDNHLIRMIDLQRNQQYFLLADEVDICWDGDLASALLVRAKDPLLAARFPKPYLDCCCGIKLLGHASWRRRLFLTRHQVPVARGTVCFVGNQLESARRRLKERPRPTCSCSEESCFPPINNFASAEREIRTTNRYAPEVYPRCPPWQRGSTCLRDTPE